MVRILGMVAALSMGMTMGCRETQLEPAGVDEVATAERRTARAGLTSAAGKEVEGEVLFHETGQGVRVQVKVDGLTPGRHGFHIHERGDCSAPDFESAGEHFAPEGHPHGAPGPASHAGDLGNIEANAEGKVETTLMLPTIALEPQSPRSIVGKAVVIHAQPDDFTTQPSGDAGDRVACGVIELAGAGR
jgi:Cu-Zn family superoxide dismutase